MTGPALSRPPPTPGRFPLGRRVGLGIRASPGACSRLPAWSGHDRYSVEVSCAVACAHDVCAAEHVDPATVVRVARAHARYADARTGRECRPTNARLAADLGMSVRQIERARLVLKRLQLLAEVRRGRNFMTKAERLAAWRNGSSQRHFASEFALLGLRRHPPGCRCPVRHVDLPSTTEGGLFISRKRVFLSGTNRARARTSGPPGRPHPRKAPPPRATAAQARAQRLIAGVQQRVTWLRGTSPRRLTSLHRFAAQRWTPRDVQLAIDDALRAKDWTLPGRIKRPAAYLATLLRDVDPADRPSALEEAMLAAERARRGWEWQRATGWPCEHGAPAGDIPHPASGHIACVECRARKREREARSTTDKPP